MSKSPAEILVAYLIAQGHVVRPGAAPPVPWTVYAGAMPDMPNEAVTLYDTAGRIDGHFARTHTVAEHEGIQVRVRALKYNTAWNKAKDIARALALLDYTEVTIETVVYKVWCFAKTSGPLSLGQEDENKRSIVTLNGLVSIFYP
jgi:hypothetical protein